MHLRPAFCALTICFFSVPLAASAQESQQNAQKAILAAEDLTRPVFVPEAVADPDIGVQMLMEPRGSYDPFQINAYTGWYFTDNALVVESDEESDHLWNSRASVAYVPIIAGNLYGETTVAYEAYRYADHSEQDFDSLDAGAGLIYVARKLGDLNLFVRYNYNEFLNDEFLDNYLNHSVQTGFYKPFVISRRQFVYVSYISEISLDGNPGFAERDDHSLLIGYRLTPHRKLQAEVYYRFSVLDYDARDREDLNHLAGASLTCNLTRNVYVSASTSYSTNDSNIAGGDYQAWYTGVRFGAHFQF